MECQRRARVIDRSDTHLNQWLGRLEEMLLSVALGAFLEPVYDSLIRNTVFVVQHLRHKINNTEII